MAMVMHSVRVKLYVLIGWVRVRVRPYVAIFFLAK